LNKEVKFVRVECRNPMMPFSFEFETLEDAEGDIDERLRWGELERVMIFYKDGTKDVDDFDAWGS
jgi:hypothetical protein